MKDFKALFGEALVLVSRENPELAEEYRQEVLKSDTRFEAPREKEGFTSSPMAANLIVLAKDRAAHDVVTFAEGLRRVGRDRPVLASDYRKEVTKSKF